MAEGNEPAGGLNLNLSLNSDSLSRPPGFSTPYCNPTAAAATTPPGRAATPQDLPSRIPVPPVRASPFSPHPPIRGVRFATPQPHYSPFHHSAQPRPTSLPPPQHSYPPPPYTCYAPPPPLYYAARQPEVYSHNYTTGVPVPVVPESCYPAYSYNHTTESIARWLESAEFKIF